MSLPFRNAGTRARTQRLVVAAVCAAVLGGCDREQRNFRVIEPASTGERYVRTTSLHAGPGVPDSTVGAYQDNAWAVSEGQRLFTQMNCAGCHSSGGGGGMGPPLTDAEWRYGSEAENIFDTIRKGRPRGMPSFAQRLTAADTWKLVAYVRTLGGLTRKDTWTPRTEDMAGSSPAPDERGRKTP